MTPLFNLHRTAKGSAVWVTGNGPTVILIHGVLVDHRMWARQVTALAPHYRICCLDMLGHGDSPDLPGKRRLEDFVAQAHEVVMLFSENGPPVLGGFSMGGLVAQAYAVTYPESLGGLILMNTVYDRSPEESARVIARYEGNLERGVENAVDSGTRRWFKPADYEIHGDAIAETIALMRDGDFAAKRKAHAVFVRADKAAKGKLGTLPCPALVMTGAEDSGSTPAMAEKMAAAIPNAELRILDGQHHMMPVLDSERVNNLLLNFLRRCCRHDGFSECTDIG